jgi:hypothetical protein
MLGVQIVVWTFARLHVDGFGCERKEHTRLILCWGDVQVTLGYVIPLVGLSVKEIMERYEYARLKGLHVVDLGSSLRCELSVVLKMVISSVMAAAVCFWGF